MGGNKKNEIKRHLRKLREVKNWQLLLIFILLLFVSATLLRFDHIKMTKLRDAVLVADKEGNSEALAEDLTKLQKFTLNHIVVNVVDENGVRKLEFGTGVFYLENSYLRDATAAINRAAEAEIDDSNPNGNIYAAASAVCRPRAIANGWAWNSSEYLSCFTDELAKYPATATTDGTVAASIPSTDLYRREFVSPIWAPCLSGFVIIITLILGVVIFIRFLIWACLEITLIIMKNS